MHCKNITVELSRVVEDQTQKRVVHTVDQLQSDSTHYFGRRSPVERLSLSRTHTFSFSTPSIIKQCNFTLSHIYSVLMPWPFELG